MKDNRIVIRASADENRQIRLSARLRHQSVAEYVKRALNASLRHQGIDAVLFRERESRQQLRWLLDHAGVVPSPPPPAEKEKP